MAKKLYVGNLSYETTETQLRELFSQVGAITEVTMITDRDTGRSKGFAFVQMEDDNAAQDAIKRFNGHEMGSRTLNVSEARPIEERPTNGGFSRGDANRRSKRR